MTIPVRPLLFWMDVLTPHWHTTLGHLAHILQTPVSILATQTAVAADRSLLGWAANAADDARVEVRAKPAPLELANQDWRNHLHVVCNPFNNRVNRALLRVLDQQGALYGLQQSRPGLMSGTLGRVARAIAFRTVFRQALLRARFVLCHGSFCRTYLRGCGVAEDRLFDSGYFVEPPAVLRLDDGPSDPLKPVRAVYLGQFIARKQVLPFARSLPQSDGHDWTLDLIGAGPQESQLRVLLSGRPCRLLPLVPYQQVMPTLTAYEVLVLPSRADEWGVVINEAIHAGCAVITTEQCGAADLVRNGGCGMVVADAPACARALVKLARDRPRLNRYRAAARAMSTRITATSGAGYLASLFRHVSAGGPRPLPPWMDAGT